MMGRLVSLGIIIVFIGSVCLAHADQMDDVVQTLIRESSEESLEDVEATLLKLGPVAVDSLVRLLASDDSALRMTAVRVLGRMDQSTDEKLFQALRDDRWKVRVAAVSVLAHHTSGTVVQRLLAILQDPHPAVRSASARALGRIGDTEATEALIRVLQDPQRLVRKSAAMALGKIGDRRATAPLVATLQDDAAVKRESMRALVLIGQPAVQSLSVIVADAKADPAIRQSVARVLGDIASPDGADALGVALRDNDVGVRRASADALVLIGQPAVEVLRIALLEESDPSVRAEAATILGRSGSATVWATKAVNLLIMALADQDAHVRAAVRQALVRVHAIAYPQVVTVLRNDNPLLRGQASTILGKIGHRGAIAPLETLLKTEPHPAVRESITAALVILHAKPTIVPRQR